MEHRDDDYYEVNAGFVRPEDITSSPQNATILQRLCNGDDTLNYIEISRPSIIMHYQKLHKQDFAISVSESYDLGWLGYFIGNSEYLQHICIEYLPEDEGGEQRTHAFLGGIARSQSIRSLNVRDQFVAVASVLGRLSQLDDLDLSSDAFGRNGCLLRSLEYMPRVSAAI